MADNSSRIRIQVPQKELNEFCQKYQIKRLALFGSVLRKDFQPESDVDVLVLFSPKARIGILTLSRMRRELSGLFNRRVELVPMDGLKPAIREHAFSDIEEIYANRKTIFDHPRFPDANAPQLEYESQFKPPETKAISGWGII